MNKLSKREKCLVVGLLITVIFVASFFLLIKPIIKVREAQLIQIETLKAEAEQERQIAQTLDSVKKKLEEAKAEIVINKVGFYEPMFSWQAEREVTGVLYQHDIVVDSITMAEPKPFVIGEADAVTTGETKTDNTTVNQGGVSVITVMVKYKCSLENLMNYLDAIASYPQKISLSNWDYTVKEGALEGSLVLNLYILNS